MNETRGKLVCPLCDQTLFKHSAHRKGVYECRTETCWLFGLEGSSFNWITLNRLAKSKSLVVDQLKEDLEVIEQAKQ